MAALAGDSLLKGEAMVEDFMGNDLLQSSETLEEELKKDLLPDHSRKDIFNSNINNLNNSNINNINNSNINNINASNINNSMYAKMNENPMNNVEPFIKTELGHCDPININKLEIEANRGMNPNMNMNPNEKEALMSRGMLPDHDPRRGLLFGSKETIHGLMNDDQIKLEMNDLCVKEELEEDEEVAKVTPQSLFKLNGMSREQLESLDFPTIPIRKKRGRPKKTPDDPNMPDRPRQRSVSSQQQQQMNNMGIPGGIGPPNMMCNGLNPVGMDEMPRKKRGRPKKLLPDGSVPPPKRPGRKPKPLKEMLQHAPPMGGMGNIPMMESSPHHMNHMNSMMPSQDFSPNHNNQTFSPQYGASQVSMMGQPEGIHNRQHFMNPQLDPLHQNNDLTSMDNINPSLNSNPAMRGNTPQHYDHSPGYTSSPIQQGHMMHYPPLQQHMPVEEEQRLGLSPPPVSPTMTQHEFDPAMSETEMTSRPTPPSHKSSPSAHAENNQPNLSHMSDSSQDPRTPVDSLSYPSYHHGFPPNVPVNQPSPNQLQQLSHQIPGSVGTTNKNDVTSKSLSGLESLVDQIPSISGDHHETSSQHSVQSSTHSSTHSANHSNPTTPAPSVPQQPPFSPGPTYTNNSPYQSQPNLPKSTLSHYNSPQHPYSPLYSSPQQAPYSPHYPSNNNSNFSVTSLAHSSHTHSFSSSAPASTTPSSSPPLTTSSLTGSSPTPAPSLYSSSSYTAAHAGPSHLYPEVIGSPMMAPTPPMASPYVGSAGRMNSPSSMAGGIQSPMPPSGSNLPYPYPPYNIDSHYGGSHSPFAQYSSSSPSGFHVPSPRFPYPSPYINYAQGYSQNAMLERIKHQGMGMGFGGF